MGKKEIVQEVAFDPKRYSHKVQALIMAAADTWGMTPSEAASKILTEVAGVQVKGVAA